jgi:AraC family transcriptional regulator
MAAEQLVATGVTGARRTATVPTGDGWWPAAADPGRCGEVDRSPVPHHRGDGATGGPGAGLRISPPEAALRQKGTWGALAGETVRITETEPFEASFCGATHLLIATEFGARHEGETYIEGLPRSPLHDTGGKLSFVPAGRRFHEWQRPRLAPRFTCLYLDPGWAAADAGLSLRSAELEPRLFFRDASLWSTAGKLTREIEKGGSADRLYIEALGLVLGRELLRVNRKPAQPEAIETGGLAGWQRNRAADYIEAHLADPISLAALAAVVRLSPYHFARAFKRSFGIPPHRYHTERRIERAKSLLACRTLSITEIALDVGFSGPSSFAMTFRRLVGRTPTSYRRNLS